ncbi:glycosyltransferase family 1 protein [Oceanicola sp. 502str15]|uniref:glycosyltransferase family 4 protein n=1 Tax=Oceanicola sp. 502str15 TaxID=2696061 RepID=UPI002095220B|nr:glycosyltransferase family 1 protein [Oceanicola sp. 502str15]MCO6381953.1 glycosyltransferase [Oceanicola sp. 502str15]
MPLPHDLTPEAFFRTDLPDPWQRPSRTHATQPRRREGRAGRSFAVNARFLTRPVSGVDRVARALLVALSERPDIARLRLIHPERQAVDTGWIEALEPAFRAKFTLHPFGRRRGHLWEQVDLPRARGGDTLLSLCTTGPLAVADQLVLIHDAQVWDAPQSYSRRFRLAYRLLLPALARRARRVATISSHSAARLEALGVVPRGKLRVVLNGADHMRQFTGDPTALGRFGLEPGRYVLAVGSAAPHKNLDLLLRAAEQGAGKAPLLVIAGALGNRIYGRVSLESGARVKVLGHVSDGELKALYHGAMALAFPSLTEGFGLPPLEAMLCGCPVLASTGGALPEICGPAATLLDPQDATQWSEALQRIATDGPLRMSMGRKGRDHAARYTWERAAARLLEVAR